MRRVPFSIHFKERGNDMSEELYGKMTKTDLYNNSKISRLTAYLLFLSNEETDPSILPRPMNAEEEEVYKLCVLNGPASAAHGAAKADASNFGANLGEENDNSEDWGDALGGGEIASGEKKLITGDTVWKELAKYVPIAENAGFHNSIYRGKDLGANLTDAQIATIAAQKFDDLYIGDYWSKKISYTYYKATADTEAAEGKTYYADVEGTALDEQPTAGADISEAGYCEQVVVSNQSMNFRIAGFNYFLNTGDTNCTTPHVVVVPDTALFSAPMNKTNTTTGAYIGSDFYTGTNGNHGLSAAKKAAIAAFGSDHILSHKEYLPNAVTSGRQSAGAWYASTVELLSEHMVYGSKFFEPTSDGSNVPNVYTVGKGQLPLFALDHSRITTRGYWWLRSVVSGSFFAFVDNYGYATYRTASGAYGVRPYFAIY